MVSFALFLRLFLALLTLTLDTMDDKENFLMVHYAKQTIPHDKYMQVRLILVLVTAL